jgi:hypothetical protein
MAARPHARPAAAKIVGLVHEMIVGSIVEAQAAAGGA